jgi:hypothetical protein
MQVINLTSQQFAALVETKNFGTTKLFDNKSVPAATYNGAQLSGAGCSLAATATTDLLDRAVQTPNGGDEAPAYAH